MVIGIYEQSQEEKVNLENLNNKWNSYNNTNRMLLILVAYVYMILNLSGSKLNLEICRPEWSKCSTTIVRTS
jgi:hypothetical protein